MIKFFRHIRQSMIDQNRAYKYLLYAIGEIILVVIGILIALQINNWNSDRIESIKEQSFLNNIQRDLDLQLQAIESQIAYEKEIIMAATAIISNYKKDGGFSVDSTFTAVVGQISGRMTFSMHNATYSELLTSGNLDIISNEKLKNKFIKFNQGLERTAVVLSKNNDFVDKIFIPDLMDITEAQLSSIFEVESFSDVFNTEDELYQAFRIDLNEERLKEITKMQLAKPENELTLINEVNYRNRIAMVAFQFLNTQKKNLISLKDDLAKFTSYHD